MPDFSFELKSLQPVAGIDEAGSGPWAGPVVASAVILPLELDPKICRQLNDSKKLKRGVREELLSILKPLAKIGIGIASAEEIDQINILQATFLAMRRAVELLPLEPQTALVDGNQPPSLSCAVRTIVKGDNLSLSIAAASIVAKVTRDRIMADLHLRYPGYGWDRNSGYGTKEHQNAIRLLGITPAHRKSFNPIRVATATYSS